MTELFYIIRCQYINRRGGGFLIELRAQEADFRLRRQAHDDVPDLTKFRQRQIDSERPYTEVVVETRAVMAILDQLARARLVPVPPLTGGFDGATYILAIRNIESEAVFTWWLDCPAVWEPLATAWDAFVALANNEEEAR